MLKLIILFISLVSRLLELGGNPQLLVDESPYSKFALTDSTTLEVYEYESDSALVVFTVCAPQCSSCARIYNKEWDVIRTITPPFTSIFPLATIEDGQLVWSDNDDWDYQSIGSKEQQ